MVTAQTLFIQGETKLCLLAKGMLLKRANYSISNCHLCKHTKFGVSIVSLSRQKVVGHLWNTWEWNNLPAGATGTTTQASHEPPVSQAATHHIWITSLSPSCLCLQVLIYRHLHCAKGSGRLWLLLDTISPHVLIASHAGHTHLSGLISGLGLILGPLQKKSG